MSGFAVLGSGTRGDEYVGKQTTDRRKAGGRAGHEVGAASGQAECVI
jgi:hypothetical protein